MDPLTSTLAIVTLATAVKDVVEVARRIDDSLSRVSRNDETMRVLSKQIVKTVLDLQIFCDEHAEALEKSSPLKTAVVDLHNEMKLVEGRIRTMLPRPPKIRFLAWLRRNKVEEGLKLILEHVRDCYLRFTTFSVLRIEGRLVLESTTEMGCIKKPMLLLEVSDKSIAAFVERSATGGRPSRATYELTKGLLGDMYLRLQVEDIISCLATATINPCENHPFDSSLHVTLVYSRTTEHISVIQSRAVEKALHLQETLRAVQHDCLSTIDADLISNQIHDLSCAISHLDMIDEEISLCLQYLRLTQPLVETNLSTRICAAYALHNLSDLYGKKDDKESQLKSLAQAADFLRDSGESFWDQLCMSDFIAGQRHLWDAQLLWHLGDLSGAIVEARNVLDLTETYLSKPPQEIQHIYTAEIYLQASLLLGPVSWKRDYLQEAVEGYKRALRAAEYVHLLGQRPDEHNTAEALYWLSHPTLRPILPADEHKQYLRRSVELYRKLSLQSPSKYGEQLYVCLWRERSLLLSQGRNYEALILAQEAKLWSIYVG